MLLLRFGVDVDVDADEDVGVLRSPSDWLPPPLTVKVETIEMLSSGQRSFSSGWEGRGVEAMITISASVVNVLFEMSRGKQWCAKKRETGKEFEQLGRLGRTQND